MNDLSKNVSLLLLNIGFAGITGLGLILWITPFGAGVSPDSCIYIGAAKSLMLGNGFSFNGEPITQFPFFYPLTLAAVGLLENNLVQAARFLNAFLFGTNVGLFALAVYLAAGRNFLTTTCAVFFFLSSGPLLELHSMAWSEPLFITFSLSCIVVVSLYLERPTLFLLVVLSLLLGVACVTRYIGVAFLPAVLSLVFLGGSSQKVGEKFRNTLICLVVSSVPIAVLLARNIVLAGSTTNRSIIFHPISVTAYITQLVTTMRDFVAPGYNVALEIKLFFFVMLAVLLTVQLTVVCTTLLKDVDWRSMSTAIQLSCFLFSFWYLLFLFLSICVVDAETSLDFRFLCPVFSIMTVGMFSAVWTLSQTVNKPRVFYCFLLFVTLSISIKTSEAIRSAYAMQENGLKFTSRQWCHSETIAFVRLLPEDVRIYSNEAIAIDFLTGKKSLFVPKKISPNTMVINPHFDEEILAMCKDIMENKAVLIYFNRVNWRWYLPISGEVATACQLPVLRSLADGTVYGVKDL